MLWETHVATDERVEVRPGKFEEIKQVFAEEIASIFIIAIKVADDISIEGGVSANNKKDFFLRGDCVQWINKRLVAMDAELEVMIASFDELKSKLRVDVCEEAYGEFQAGRSARISDADADADSDADMLAVAVDVVVLLLFG